MASGDLLFEHITSFLNFSNEESRKKQFVLAIKDSLSDLSFVFADFLSFYIKQDYPVILVNLAQSFHHYNYILLKSGINLKTLREQDKIIQIDVLGEAENVISCPADVVNNLQTLSSVVLNSSDSHCLKPLYESIETGLKSILKLKPKQFILLIDEINVLINLGVPLKAIQLFIQRCFALCVNGTETAGLLLVGALQDGNDSESVKYVNFLSHICDIELHIEGLKTGYSKDIQGKMSVKTRDKAHGSFTNQKLFFKVEDKGAKYFTLSS
ncbi:elongator complex protein 6 [Parasteatoda tepidariorum]|uniref:elongator complex protein 6 n=1 Tax=Parasteatoda tepidariorum TaxID=114398 RepID=UPI00077FD8C4|nr:elongator complex protein 6 isoform X2 [Parasteatoda tepidariorum]